MAFVLSSIIRIGKYAFSGGVNELTIHKSVNSFCDTATLKIPGFGRVIGINKIVGDALSSIGLGAQFYQPLNLPNSSVETARLLKEGDPVSIDLGYNGDMRNEFRGFVRRVTLSTPVVVEMEGYAWQLRSQNILASWKTATVKEVLTRIIQGTDIVLSPDIPEIMLTGFHIPNWNGFKVLEYLKGKQQLTVYFADNVLYVGLQAGRTTATGKGQYGTLAEVIYNIGINCILKQPNLKQRLGSDNRVRVRLKTHGKDGKHTLYEAGDTDGSVIAITIPFSNDAQYLQGLANEILKKSKYDGFEGTITGFLQPFCQPGWKAVLKDKRYNGARAGTYFVPGIEVTFGVKGARRKVELSYRLDTEATQLV